MINDWERNKRSGGRETNGGDAAARISNSGAGFVLGEGRRCVDVNVFCRVMLCYGVLRSQFGGQ